MAIGLPSCLVPAIGSRKNVSQLHMYMGLLQQANLQMASFAVHIMQGSLNIGAAVTQTALIDYLLDPGTGQHSRNGDSVIEQGMAALSHNEGNGKGPCPHGGTSGVYTALAHHLQRIAGNQVLPLLTKHQRSDKTEHVCYLYPGAQHVSVCLLSACTPACC